MKNKNDSYKPRLIIDGYQMKKCLGGGFKIVQYSHFSNESFIRKRVLYKRLSLSDAEDKMYRLESSINK